ncbi:MAG: hypothetical protein F6K48_20095 [Okeania sp. SIO3H1]|uniref:hypothetical protein n=1 Tax=Okeania sp. SIO1I7 TaxID=2607772 RepID=UPI0013C7A8B5|nr:hypothetical protein [Okeania sp. SIO1I7]NEN91080.1 hypothetical protein [Okeania sp. SIO3H1]NET25428.1 hypothetical protein [Okeania sp. SIO1I7]
MSEDQPQQPNLEQPETEAVYQESTETASVTPESSPQQQSTTKEKSVVAKPSLGQQVLGLVRSLLPESLSQKLSDGLLTGTIAGIFVLILVIIFVSFSPGQPPTEVADIPIAEETEAIALEESLPLSVDPEVSENSFYEAPESVEPIIVGPPKLTPEQILIVSIQNQIDDLTNQYGAGIIESLRVNFPSSLLIVELNNDWYDKTEEEQDKLVNQMFQEAQDLDFSKLQVMNSQDRIIARSSVINSEMIVLERSLLEIPG